MKEPTKDELDECIRKERMRVKNIAIEQGLITPEELAEYEGKYIDEFGCDSFINYLSYLSSGLSGQAGVFLTMNEKIIKDREDIQKRFGLKIVTIEEMGTMKK
jgi:hypothetical protein